MLAGAIGAGFDGQPLESTLAGYQEKRDYEALPMYEFTTELASLEPPPAEGQMLFSSLAGRPGEIDRFLGVLTGAVPMREYMTLPNLVKIIGVRGMAKVMLSRIRKPRPRAPHRESLAQA